MRRFIEIRVHVIPLACGACGTGHRAWTLLAALLLVAVEIRLFERLGAQSFALSHRQRDLLAAELVYRHLSEVRGIERCACTGGRGGKLAGRPLHPPDREGRLLL